MTLEEAIAIMEDPTKHTMTCSQGELATWLKELKELREENKVLISECDRLIKEKGELLSKVSGGDVLRICQLEEQLEKTAAENAKLKAFITSIYQILGEHFEYPCSNEVVAEIMKERSTCFDCGEKINNEECWERYFTTVIEEE